MKIRLRSSNSGVLAQNSSANAESKTCAKIAFDEEIKLSLTIHRNRFEYGALRSRITIDIDCGNNIFVENYLEIHHKVILDENQKQKE